MTIPPECEAQILRYFHVEKWPPTTIARQLNDDLRERVGAHYSAQLFEISREQYLHAPRTDDANNADTEVDDQSF